MSEIAPSAAFADQLQIFRQRADRALLDFIAPLPFNDGNMVAAMRHGALLGGKRLRPFLVYTTGQMFGVSLANLDAPAAAVECIHAYSLIHDDLPAMDNDDMRRGKPTVHKAFGEAEAILAGDSLLTFAFELLASEETHPDPFVRTELVLELARASGINGMVGGQMMDIAAETAQFDLATVTRLQQLKTGALIGFSLEGGAILGRVPPEGRTGLRGYARDVGLAFQIADDLLDAEGNEELAGKKLGKDEAAGKATFLSLLGRDRARAQAEVLVGQAIDHLRAYGPEADLLRAIARFTLDRDR